MSLELKTSSTDGLIMRFNGYTLRFSLREFAIISGLNCVSSKADFVFDTSVPNRLLQKYFGGEEEPYKVILFQDLDDQVWGKEAFEELSKTISRKLKSDSQYYRLHGMPYAMQVLDRVMEIKVQTASATQLEKLIDESDSAKEINDAVEIKCHPVDQTEVDECTAEHAGSSSRMPKMFGIKHPFVSDTIYGSHNDKLYSRFLDWVHEGMVRKHTSKFVIF
ncbi:hypothetical protein BC332_31761 [Capsicum chinense]|nr:hypothetical protein BC332_31761 [Capsicum chinense]